MLEAKTPGSIREPNSDAKEIGVIGVSKTPEPTDCSRFGLETNCQGRQVLYSV
ncbi:MAG: hypothetical protein KatS3mg105_0404 [Gemmatales bacterium]|nr:MAG: hypothetical protein KatS3mg105_0404 [Gemmatales bacterium]